MKDFEEFRDFLKSKRQHQKIKYPNQSVDKKFRNTISELLESGEVRAELSEAIKKLALPNATSDIVDEIEKLIKDKAARN